MSRIHSAADKMWSTDSNLRIQKQNIFDFTEEMVVQDL